MRSLYLLFVVLVSKLLPSEIYKYTELSITCFYKLNNDNECTVTVNY